MIDDIEKFKVGDKVLFVNYWDIFPHTIIDKGERGTIAEIDDEIIYIKMDTPKKELNGFYNNYVQIPIAEKEKPYKYKITDVIRRIK